MNERYHTDTDGELILDEDGEPILKYMCICAAYNSYECCCGAWDTPLPEESGE